MKPPSDVVAVIFAVPTLAPLTTPRVVTVATPVLLEDQTTAVLDALGGWITCRSVVDCPLGSLTVAGVMDTLVTGVVTRTVM